MSENLNWGIETKASDFLFYLLKKLIDEKNITKNDIQGLSIMTGKVLILEDSFEQKHTD